MANFQTNIEQVGGGGLPTAAPVVDKSSSVGLDLFSDVVRTALPQFAAARKEQAKIEAQQAKDTALSSFATQQLKLADAVEMGDLSSREARMRMRANYTSAIGNSPGLVTDLAKVQKDIVSTSGLGKVVADGTDQEQFMLAAEKEATLNGWVPPHLGEEDRAEATQKYLTFKRNQDLLQQQASQVALQTAKINQQSAVYSRDTARLNLQSKQRTLNSQVAIGKIADSYNFKFNNDLNEIIARHQRGEINDTDAQVAINQQYAIIQQTVSQIGAEAPTEYVNNMVKPMTLRYQNALDLVSGKITNEALKNRNENIIAQQTLNLLGDPDVAKGVATSKLFNNASSTLLSTIDATVVKIMNKNTTNMGGKPVDIMPDNDQDKQTAQGYLDIVKENLKSVNSGSAIDKDGTAQELDLHVSQLLNSVNAYGPTTARPQDFNQIVDFLADPSFGKYTSSKGGVPADSAASAKNVLSQQYEQVVLPLIKQEYESALVNTATSLPSRLGGTGQKQSTDTTKVIKPVFTGSGVVFQAAPGSSLQVQRKAQDLNKSVSPVLNRLIRMSAHLDGNIDYKSAYMNNYEALFGEEEAKTE